MCVSGESGRSQFRAHCWDRGFAEKPSVAPKQALLDAGAELKGSMQPPLIKHLKHPIVSKPQRRFEQLMTYCMGNRQTFSLVIKTNSSLTIKRSRFFFQETYTFLWIVRWLTQKFNNLNNQWNASLILLFAGLSRIQMRSSYKNSKRNLLTTIMHWPHSAVSKHS